MTRILALLAAILLATTATAHDYRAGDLELIHPAIRIPAKSASATGGYLVIVNHGATDDRLIGAQSPAAASAMVHESKVDASGVATMSHLPALDIPAGATVKLERGGLHIMFMGLSAPMAEGDSIPVTLIFEKAGPVDVEFKVEAMTGSTETHSHGTDPAPSQ